MLLQEKGISDSNLKSNLKRSAEQSDLGQLRKLLLGSEYSDLLELQRDFSDHSHTSQKISEVISEAIALRSKQDNSLTHALAPSVEEAIHSSVKRNPKKLANALFPVIGPAIREAVTDMVISMMQQVNQLLENSLSIRSIKWRIDAFRTNRTFAEVMLAETVLYQVEQVFLIHRESSLLINHLTSEKAIVKDPDMVSGMLTAVTDFVKDSFVVDKQQNVKSIRFGQLNLLIEAGPYAILVAAVRGITPADIRVTLQEQIEELHRLYSIQLEAYDGEPNLFPDTYTQLNRCLLSKSKQDQVRNDSKIPWAAIAVVLLLLSLPVIWFISSIMEQSKWNDIIQELQQEPGLVILNHKIEDGSYIVSGLRDSFSREPQQISAALLEINRPIEWEWQSYFSTEDEIVMQRIQSVLDLPSSVKIDYTQGRLSLIGEAGPNWISSLSNKIPLLWGVKEINQSQLRTLNEGGNLQQLIGSLEAVVLEFPPNASQLEPNQYKKLSEVSKLIGKAHSLAVMENVQFKIGVLGFADKTGNPSANNTISEKRARHVHDALVQLGISEEIMLAKGLGEFASLTNFANYPTCVSQRCVVFESYPARL